MSSAIPKQAATPLLRTDFHSLPRALGGPPVTGVIRNSAADFIVTEDLSFRLSGAGEHLYLRIRKTGQNTRWIAKQLAGRLGLPIRAVGFAGLKDRHAVTEQWFSLYLPGRPDPESHELDIEGVELLECCRHTSKLRIGALAGNRFRIVVRGLQGSLPALETRLEAARAGRLPNFFGAQRFGRDGRNVDLLSMPVRKRSRSRDATSFGLSAIRSALFNGYLAERIDDDTWDRPLPGEILYCDSTGRYRHVDNMHDGDGSAHPTGLLWGPGQNQATSETLQREHEYFGRFPDPTALLAAYDVRMMRRPLGLRALELAWHLNGDVLELRFQLRRGQYATAVLREIVDFSESVDTRTDIGGAGTC